MNNTIATNPEQQIANLSPETQQETVNRVAALPHILHGEQDTDRLGQDPLHLNIVGLPSRGEYQWMMWFSDPEASGKIPVDQTSDANLQVAAQKGVEEFHEVDERLANAVRWWDIEGHHDLREDVEANLTEVIRFQSGESSIDILNLSGEKLTAEEQQKITDTLEKVAAFTGNRIFKTTTGIALRKGDRFNEGSAGEHATVGGFISINIDNMRASEDVAQPRYSKYFPHGGLSKLQITLAHELGHNIDERGIKQENPHPSFFNDKFGWQEIENAYDDEKECPDMLEPITDYGSVNPSEDFAETFAILAMGGDTSQIPDRTAAMKEFIAQHVTEGDIGPVHITDQHMESLSPLLPTSLVIKPYVSVD